MQYKKHPKANLDNYSKLFVQLGLVLSLAIAYFLLESKTFNNEILVYHDPGLTTEIDNTELIEYKLEPPKPKPVIQSHNINNIEKKEDDVNIKETFINVIDIDKPVEPTTFIEVPKIDEPFKEDVPFIAVEYAPLFPGCKGKNQEELRACFTSKIRKFVGRNFNSDLAQDMGLSSGIKRIHTVFKIDENGNVVDIQARSPHKALEIEAQRVINLLPKMVPGKQGNTKVGVKYAMPIVFKVE